MSFRLFAYSAALLMTGLFLKTDLRAQEAEGPKATSGADSHYVAAATLLEVKRIYVAQLTGGVEADSLRELLISSIEGSKLFILTENEERADAILKGAADDHSFTDTFDSQDNVSLHTGAGVGGGNVGGNSTRSKGGFGNLSIGENDSSHIRERKHEAYAAVRLCNRDGDVLWSTTQESLGAKFRGASADVAAKVARQLTLDVDRARKQAAAPVAAPKP